MIARKEIGSLSLYHILPLILLVEGFISIAIEILTIRQLLPVAGGSVIVTSLIIAVFLLFLALGYQRGGKSYSHPRAILRQNFFIAAIWFGIGLSYLFVEYFFNIVQLITGPRIVYPLTAYLLLIIAPLIFILGQTVPITMNMVKQTSTAGRIGGNALGLSTLGSFLGAITTTLIFMSYLGVGWTVTINMIFLFLLSLLLVETRLSFIFQLCMTIGICSLIYNINVPIEQSLFVLTNNYANYQIQDSHNSKLSTNEKILIINNGLSSYISADKKSFRYAELIKKILFNDLKLTNKEILVLGAGGFSLSEAGAHHNHFTYVDIDSHIKKIVIPAFTKEFKHTLIIDDARHYVQSTLHHYDVIISDAYSDIKAIPSHLMTHEFLIAIQKKLTLDGLAVFNIIANPMLSDPYSKHLDNTIRSVFSNCMVIPVTYANTSTNIIYMCHNNHGFDNKIYSDNLNNSTTESFSW